MRTRKRVRMGAVGAVGVSACLWVALAQQPELGIRKNLTNGAQIDVLMNLSANTNVYTLGNAGVVSTNWTDSALRLGSNDTVVWTVPVPTNTTLFFRAKDASEEDVDSDGLNNRAELLVYKTDPNDPDCDDDGASDWEEVTVYQTDPFDADTDDDGSLDGIEVHFWGSNPKVYDTDNDGLSDGEEAILWTNPQYFDTDWDTLPDGWEVHHGLNPKANDANEDPDGDGLLNKDEGNLTQFAGWGWSYTWDCGCGPDPQVADSDGDGVNDGTEVWVWHTSPVNATEDKDEDGLTDAQEILLWHTQPHIEDTDGDHMADGWEVRYGLNPTNELDGLEDLDQDGLPNYQETGFVWAWGWQYGRPCSWWSCGKTNALDPTNPDTDGDGLTDGQEVWEYGTNPKNALGDKDGDGLIDADEVLLYTSLVYSADSDEDGVGDYAEVMVYGSNPRSTDSDGDGLSDFTEVHDYHTSPALRDTDADGLDDYLEVNSYGSNPLNMDTDGDLMPDGWEIQNNFNALDGTDATLDFDGDGLSNRNEYYAGTDPRNAADNMNDQDLDGVPDRYDQNPAQSNYYVTVVVTNDLPYLYQPFQVGSGTPKYSGHTLPVTPALPNNTVYIKRATLSGWADDAFKIRNIPYAWSMDYKTFSNLDITDALSERQTGRYDVVVYDYVASGFPNNYVGFGGKAVYECLGLVKVDTVDIVGAPSDGLVVRKGNSVTFTAKLLPESYVPPENEPKWFYQKLRSDGLWESWQSFGPNAHGKEYTHTTVDSGIFRLKAVLTDGATSCEKVYERTAHDAYSTIRAGDPNTFGIVDNMIQITVRNSAREKLGSTYYASGGSLPLLVDPLSLFNGLNKCNVFIADICEASGADVDPPIAGVYLGSPPSANNWAGMPDINDPNAPYPIPNWILLGENTAPQPGHICASGYEMGASGHSGIVDYDGQWISAGPTNVNRKAEFSGYKRHYSSGATKSAGQRSYSN